MAKGKKQKKVSGPALVKRRTNTMYKNHKAKAEKAGVWILYTRDDLADLINTALKKETCPYCRQQLTPENFSGDHKQPTSRNGKHELSNLIICCRMCNQAKADLDFEEYKQLWITLDSWNRDVALGFLRRLARANSSFRWYPKKNAT